MHSVGGNDEIRSRGITKQFGNYIDKNIEDFKKLVL